MSLSPSGYSSFPPTSFSSILAQLASSHRETLVQGQRTLSQLSPAPIHNVSSRALRGRSTVVGPLDLDLLLHRTEMMANPMRPASNNGELSVFIGLLPSDVTSDEILSLIRPHVPLDIHLRPVGRIVNGQRRSIAGELVFSNPDERQACLAEFGHLDLYCRRWPRPIRVEAFRPFQSSSLPATPERRSERSSVSTPIVSPREQEEVLEALSDWTVRDAELEKKRKNLRERQKLENERAEKRRIYRLLAEQVERKLLEERKTQSAHESTIRKSQEAVENSKNRCRELSTTADSLKDQHRLTMEALDQQSKQLVQEWKNLQQENAPEAASETKQKSSSEFSVEPEIECVVCVEPMLGPIFQCRNGHCVCDTCYGRMTQCGMCRVKLERPGIRCRLLETLVQKILETRPHTNQSPSTDES